MSDPVPPRDKPDKFKVAFSFAGEQRDLVRRIAEAVEARLGRSTVFFDEWYEAYIAGDSADTVLQDIYGEGCDVAVVCVSERYGGKPWTLAEHAAIRNRVNRSRASDGDKDRLGVLPIRFGEGDVKGIPKFTTVVPDARNKPLDETVALILARLRFAAPEIKPAVAPLAHPTWPNEPIPFEHGLADHRDVWSAIERLMTVNAAKRILMLKGPSGYSKSALLDAAARYAKILCLPVAYVDFKVTLLLSPTGFLKCLRLDLGTLLPGFAVAQELDPWALLEALRRLSSPVLIVLDTYDKIIAIRELVDWIEIKLLAEVENCKQIRFLVGGQNVPERTHNRWGGLAEEIELKRIDDKEAWKVWLHQKNPRLDFNQFEGIVPGLEGVPGNISTVLTACAENLTATA